MWSPSNLAELVVWFAWLLYSECIAVFQRRRPIEERVPAWLAASDGEPRPAVLVTGAGSGIGRAVAIQLARMGAGAVVIACRTLTEARVVADGIRPLVPRRRPVVLKPVGVDLRDPASGAVRAGKIENECHEASRCGRVGPGAMRGLGQRV